ncbi:hypothetical protein D1007_51952 [Hordeum vulgare]|nr:hypothetical protein D1007_51952 [Hordeum vulgare]
MAERMMAPAADCGVAAKVDYGVVAAKATAGGVAKTVVGDGVPATAVTGSINLRVKVAEHVVAACAHPTRRPQTLHASGDCVADVIQPPSWSCPPAKWRSGDEGQLLAEDDKYKVVIFDHEYIDDRVRSDQKIVIAQLCMSHHVLVYLYCVATRPCERFDSENKKQKDSLVNLPAAILDPYYRDMKVECDKDKFVSHKAWVNKLDEEHIKYTAKGVYTSYKMYRWIIDMRKCLLPADDER